MRHHARASPDAALVLHFPHTLDTTGLDINYMAVGRGGCGSFVRTEPSGWDDAIPSMCGIGSEIGPATSLTAVIFAPGYLIVLVDVPSLAALPARGMDVNTPGWRCEFYRLADCGYSAIYGAESSPTGPGGTFSVRVRGEFTFSAVDAITKRAAYRLGSSAGLDLAHVRMSIAASQIATTPLVLYTYPPR